jgi:ankyrin repeat protein
LTAQQIELFDSWPPIRAERCGRAVHANRCWNRLAVDDEKRLPVNLVSNCPDNVRTVFYLLLKPPIEEKFPWSLQYAAAHRQANVVAMLVRMGTDVNAVGSEGNRALELSCLHGDAETTRFLLEHGANPNLRNKIGSTPLHDAALTGNKEVVELLLAHGADINATDSESASTPLHYAASFGHLDVVKLLVGHGATRNDFAEVAAFLTATTASTPDSRHPAGPRISPK